MPNQDNLSPTVLNKNLNVAKVTDRTITIQWEKAKDDKTPAKDIRYVVGITKSDDATDPWHIAAEAKDICEYTFAGLEAATLYGFYVMAYDEAGNCTQYPLTDGCMTAKTLDAIDDKVAPTALNKSIEVTKVTENSISIQWEKAKDDLTLAKEIRYVVGLTEDENPADPWHIVAEEKDICAFTFKNLKGGTAYGFYVMAFDEDGNMTQYPLANGCMTAKTLAPDTVAPTALSKALKVVKITDQTISIQWEKASDDRTKQKDIVYTVLLTEYDNQNDPWHTACNEKDICEFTFPGLKPGTLYGFTVKAKDKEGNVTQYPVTDGCMTAKTLADQDDRVAPTVYCRHLDVAEITNRSISIKWQKATDNETRAKDIRYVVGLTEALNDNDPWHIVREGKDICAHTFKNLKPGTTYAFYVMAFDEAGNFTQYPVHNGSLQATTEYGDNQAPVAPNREIVVKDVTENTISIQWERVKDDMTKSKDVRYVIGLTETDNDQDPWHIVGEDTNICQFTFKWLKPGTKYSFYVMAYDEAGNMTQYPGLDKSETSMTLKPVAWWRKMADRD